ncbi:nitroreductase family protein [Streptosporangium sp. NPDC050855]|uniref:nitroreductase family protein n=1 Tax=Streptosporangium sp. NPDC050855 TaxID=3366194 RepID=UPI003787E3ED
MTSMMPPAVRRADDAARGPYDGHLPAPGTQPPTHHDDRGTPLPRHPGQGRIGPLLDLALAAVPGRVRPRRVPSAGALYPVDAYVVHRGRAHRYDPVDHALAGWTEGSDPADFAIVLSLTPERTLWKYGARSLPSLLLDTGHAIGAIAAAASALGLDCHLQREADAATLNGLTGGRYGLAALAIGEPPGWPATPGAFPRPGDLVLDALAELLSVVRVPTWAPLTTPRHPAELLLGRRSGDDFSGVPAAADLRRLLDGTGLMAATETGILSAAGPVARGDARPVLASWAAGQDLLSSAAAVLLYTAPRRDYLTEHLHAGLTVHLALLEAAARGLPARAIGSWGPADLGAALGQEAGTAVIVHGAVIGARKEAS